MYRLALGFTVSTILFAGSAFALDQPSVDPAARPIALFDNALLASMKEAKQLGVSGRYEKLRPVIERTFDMPGMTGAAVGTQFAALPASDRHALIEAFTRMTAATYAHEFDGYSGQSFAIDGRIAARGDRKLVQTTLISPGDKSHTFGYVMHRVGGNWKVMDILLDGYVSQIATRRSDFSTTVAGSGPHALIEKLDSISDDLLSRSQARS